MFETLLVDVIVDDKVFMLVIGTVYMFSGPLTDRSMIWTASLTSV